MSTRELITDHNRIIEVLTRGVEQVLPSLDSLAKIMSEKRIRLYLGIDPTGSELTLGHSVVLRKLQQFADLGHEVILLVGNGTVRIGDPTGRDSTRPELTDEQIMVNFAEWQQQASKVLNFDTIEIRKNGDWLDKLNYIEMIKLLANTTVQQLLERDMFQKRLKAGLPIFGHEIIYPLIQGYDSVVMDVDLEIGGSDQLFNMMMGRTLQKNHRGKDKWVLTTPIINGTDGRKMSKSFNNYIALTEPAESMYGKTMSILDEQIVPYFTVLTNTPQSEIDQISHEIQSGENPMQYKKRLALAITELYHGTDAALQAQGYFERVVQQQDVPEEIPTIHVKNQAVTWLDLVGICYPQLSRSDRRRLIEQGGVRLNDQKQLEPLSIANYSSGDILKIGKRGYFKLQ
ncbi:MAG TPA: tyrosine--tRNA ligase [Candidatus Woesebacteria bacterium]|nr:tyrosine--tRNA ligase [Candidatus Woesebacteria bacterium]